MNPEKTAQVILHSTYAATEEGRVHIVHGGDPSHPLLLFMHGYPDSHRVWREVMYELSDAFHVAAFDMRGVAGSGPPAPAAAYRIERLVPDIEAVITQLRGPHGRAHLVAHDWGSTIAWSFVSDPKFADRVLTFTTISGPHLGLWRSWMIESLKSLNPRRVGRALWQGLKSTYVLFLLARPVPELFWRLGGVPVWRAVMRFAGVPRGDPLLDEDRATVLSMCLRPMALYRRNSLRLPPTPAEDSIGTPVCLIVPQRDPFVSEVVFENLSRFVQTLEKQSLAASHWAPRSHGPQIAALVRGFISRHSPGPAA